MVWKDNQFFKCFKSQCWDGILICIYHKDVCSGLFQRLNPRVMAFQATIRGNQPRASIVSYRTTAMFWLYAWCYLFLYERQRCMYMRVFGYAYPVCAAARGGDQVLCSITLILEAGSLKPQRGWQPADHGEPPVPTSHSTGPTVRSMTAPGFLHGCGCSLVPLPLKRGAQGDCLLGAATRVFCPTGHIHGLQAAELNWPSAIFPSSEPGADVARRPAVWTKSEEGVGVHCWEGFLFLPFVEKTQEAQHDHFSICKSHSLIYEIIFCFVWQQSGPS